MRHKRSQVTKNGQRRCSSRAGTRGSHQGRQVGAGHPSLTPDGDSGADAACWAQRCPPSRRGAGASSWPVPRPSRTCSGRAAGAGSSAAPSFLMQFANGCEEAAKPERDWEREPRCRRDWCYSATGDLARPAVAHWVLRCQSPRQTLNRGQRGRHRAKALPARDGACAGAGYNTPFHFHGSNTQTLGANPPLLALSSWFGGWQSCWGSARGPGRP